MSAVLDPSIESNTPNVEAVQIRQPVLSLETMYRRTSSAITMSQLLGWLELQTRKQHVKATVMYCIVYQLVEIPTAQYLHHTGMHIRGHTSRFLQPFTTLNSNSDFFFLSIVRLLNSLPVSLIDAPSLEVLQTIRWLPRYNSQV